MTGEIKLWPGATIPTGWHRCDGDTLLIADHADLFAVIGTTFGGDGTVNFNLPNLENRFALGTSLTSDLGEAGGEYEVILTEDNLPAHTHNVRVEVNTEVPNTNEGSDNVFGSGSNIFSTEPSEAGENLGGVQEDTVGQAKPVSVINPYLTLHYIIKL